MASSSNLIDASLFCSRGIHQFEVIRQFRLCCIPPDVTHNALDAIAVVGAIILVGEHRARSRPRSDSSQWLRPPAISSAAS